MPQMSQDFFAKLPLGLLIGLLYTNLRASTVLQRAGAVLWTAGAAGTVFSHTRDMRS